MKSTKDQFRQRVESVLRLKLQGLTTWEICSHVNADGEPVPRGHGTAWGVTVGTVRRYLRLADRLITKHVDARRDRLIAYHTAVRRRLYSQALQANDFRAALAAADSEAKLLGLFQPAPIEDVTKLTDEEIADQIRQLVQVVPNIPDRR